jgi:hypothetical protein
MRHFSLFPHDISLQGHVLLLQLIESNGKLIDLIFGNIVLLYQSSCVSPQLLH